MLSKNLDSVQSALSLAQNKVIENPGQTIGKSEQEIDELVKEIEFCIEQLKQEKMGVISLKVVIAGRTYPLNVSEEEQGKVLKAAEDINKAFELLRTNYAVKDPQDLLAMSALQLLSKNQSSAKTETVTLPADYTSIENALAQLANDIEELN